MHLTFPENFILYYTVSANVTISIRELDESESGLTGLLVKAAPSLFMNK